MRETIKFYTQRRLLIIFLFGIASGYPWLMIGSAMSAWLNELGFTRSAIGYFGAVFAAFSINFLWSPLIDRVKLPWLSNRIGQRRSWILICQLGMAGACWFLASVDFTQYIAIAGFTALSIALLAATQDIGIDAYRIDSIGEHEAPVQSAAAAMATAGWWTGYGALGAIPFLLVDLPGWDWPQVYQLMALIMLLLTAGVWLAQEPQTNRREQQNLAEVKYQRIAANAPRQTLVMTLTALLTVAGLVWGVTQLGKYPGVATAIWSAAMVTIVVFLISLLVKLHATELPTVAANTQHRSTRAQRIIAWIMVTAIEPVVEFFSRNGVRLALTVLLFVVLFKVGEAFLGRMSIVFYQEVGFSNQDIGIYSKLMNWWVTIAFALIGSYVNMRFGIVRGLFIGGSAMALSNLLFSLLALTGPNKALFVVAVIGDGFTSAWSTVAFVAVISLLVNRAFTATQYALMASLGTLGRTVLGAYSGVVVDWLDGNWAVFFLLTTVMVVPSLLLLWSIRHKVYALEQENRDRQDAWQQANGNQNKGD